jgi:hypothetical protein
VPFVVLSTSPVATVPVTTGSDVSDGALPQLGVAYTDVYIALTSPVESCASTPRLKALPQSMPPIAHGEDDTSAICVPVRNT